MIKQKTLVNVGFDRDILIENRNKTVNYKLSIIVPVFNEEENIYLLEKYLTKFVSQSPGFPVCILFVNDCSTDRSGDFIVDVCNRRQHFYYLNLDKNCGLSTALKAGIDTTRSTYLGYIDADLQTNPEDFNLLLPFIGEYEMVMGIRTKRKDFFIKRMSSKIANGFRRFMIRDGIVDTGCPLKIMRTDCAKKIPFFKGMHRFLPALIQLQNGKVKQVPVRHFPRMTGKSKYNLGNRLIAPFIDCFAYRWMKRRYINYVIAENNIV